MPPKAKAKAKGKSKGEDAPKLDVPAPPPSPVCLPLPEVLVERYASERCLLLAFADVANLYKVQVRNFTPGDTPVGAGAEANAEAAKLAEVGWQDAKEIDRVQLPNRHHHEARLYACEYVRLQYRLVLAAGPQTIDNLYVANWQSVPSEPIASYVDPPVELTAELRYENDLQPPAVDLSWRSANMEWLRAAMGADGAQQVLTGDGHGPFAAWPGLMPSKAQVRWRVMETRGADILPKEMAGGRHFVSPAVDSLGKDGFFSFREDSWRLTYREAVHGVVARFSVRVGTGCRWSPWSEETLDVLLEVPEPCPPVVSPVAARIGRQHRSATLSAVAAEALSDEPGTVMCVTLRKLEARQVEVVWPPFMTKGSLTWVEYRVVICPTDQEGEPPCFEERGIVAATFSVETQQDQISTWIRGLTPNTWYVVRIDARYPHIGKRVFSAAKAVSAPFSTPLPQRAPLQPFALAVDLDAVAGRSLAIGPDGEADQPKVDVPAVSGVLEEAEEPTFNWAGMPSVVLRMDTTGWSWTGVKLAAREVTNSLENHVVEYNAAPTAVHKDDYNFGWREPVAVEPIDLKSAGGIVAAATLGPAAGEKVSGEAGVPQWNPWKLVRIGFPRDVPEVIVCRLVRKGARPGSELETMTSPLVPYVAPPDFRHPAVWARPRDEGIRLAVRFFLHPNPTTIEEHAGHFVAANTPSPQSGKPGHRFVTRYQLRFRAAPATAAQGPASEAGAESPWVTLQPALLPQAARAHGARGSRAAPLPEGAEEHLGEEDERLLGELTACLGWSGTRYEVDVDPGTDGLRALLCRGTPFFAALRVGTDHKWSDWTAPGRAADDITALLDTPPLLNMLVSSPTPLPDSLFECQPCSATRLRLSWAPFDRPAGVSTLEYLVRATPIFGEQDVQRGLEGAGAIEKVVLATHAVRMSEDELLQGKEVRRILDDNPEVPVRRLIGLVRAGRDKEREADRDQAQLVRVEIAGLLPCTRYGVTVSARFPAAASIPLPAAAKAPAGLAARVEMPGGAAPPPAPQPLLPGEFDCDGLVAPDTRAAMLRIDNRPGYVLEYRAAQASFAHCFPQAPDAQLEFGGSWQTPLQGDQAGGCWQRVLATKEVEFVAGTAGGAKAAWLAEAGALVRAELPPFGAGGAPLSDAVEFRLCAEARSAAHPCRWAGGVSDPVAVCFAPPRLPPRVRRVLSDDRWYLTLTIELFKTASTPSPLKTLAGSLMGNDDSEEEDDDQELAYLRRMHQLPTPPPESWSAAEHANGVGRIPVGYGHRMVQAVQFRYALRSAMSAELLVQMEHNLIDKDWHSGPPILLTSTTVGGTHCTMEVGTSAGLLDGGIYMFQVRVGDGCRWSAWSHTSNAYAYRVPPPTPPLFPSMTVQQQVMVEAVSSTVARVRWCDFRPAPGLTLLEYEVRATPQQQSNGQDGQVVTTTFEHRYKGGFIEREVHNLVPFALYIFSVQARYPRIGGRVWSGQRESQQVALEYPMASQDPPVPEVFPDPEEREFVEEDFSGEVAPFQCFTTLGFPDEEDGAQYDLEYAHVLGDDQDSTEARTSQAVWHRPLEIKLLDTQSQHGHGPPRWRVQLHDLRGIRVDPLKQALLQRVRFRLRARCPMDAPTRRWWSTVSQPIATGFAAPDAAVASLSASADRLVLDVQFSLDRRLADATAAAGPEGLRAHRDELMRLLFSGPFGAAAAAAAPPPPAPAAAAAAPPSDGPGSLPPSVLGSPPGTASTGAGAATGGWPRGFGHAFVTRYQLRVRGARAQSQPQEWWEEGTGGVEWTPWEVFSDTALPKEAAQSLLVDGWFAGGAGAARPGNPQARWFAAEVPPVKGLLAQVGSLVQVSVRVGDGTKWSAWRNAKEVTVSVQPPRPARESDVAKADWVGNVCTVWWPPVAAPIGLDSIEYQLMVEPDSVQAPPRIGAVFIGPSAAAAAARAREADSVPEMPRMMSKAKSGRVSPGPGARGSVLFGARTQPLVVEERSGAARGSVLFGARTQPFPAEDRQGPRVDQNLGNLVELRDLIPDMRHGFTILARYPTVGPRTFTKIFEVPKIARRPGASTPLGPPAAPAPPYPGSPVLGAPSTTRSSAARGLGANGLPMMPVQVAPPDDGRLSRWLDEGNGRLVLLTWQGLEVPEVEDEDQAASVLSTLEVQVANVPDSWQGRAAVGARGGRHSTMAAEEAGMDAWQPCKNVFGIMVQGKPALVIRSLPYLVQQFRLFDATVMRAGVPSQPMVAAYERVDVPTVHIQALGRGVPRSMAVRLSFGSAAPARTLRWATRCQVRHRQVGGSDECGIWAELDPIVLESTDKDDLSVQVREEDGLDLGRVYAFQVRVGDRFRYGPWSEESRPLRFALLPPVPPAGTGIRVDAEANSAELSWMPFQPQGALLEYSPNFAQLPVEYTITVTSGTQNEPVTCLVTRETKVVVRPLAPAAAYSASVVGRWTRFGDPTSEDKGGGNQLLVSFSTAGLAKQLVCELNLRYLNEGSGGHGASRSNVASIPVDGASSAAVTLDLDPFFVGPRPHHMPPAFMRTPTLPPRAGSLPPAPAGAGLPPQPSEPILDSAGAARALLDGGASGGRRPLPQIVPLPPAKFQVRDPLNFSLSSQGDRPGSSRLSSMNLPRRNRAPDSAR